MDVYPATPLQSSFLIAGIRVSDAYLLSQSWNLPPGINVDQIRHAFDSFVDHPNGMMLRTLFLFEPILNQWLQVLLAPGRKRLEWTVVTVANEAELDLCSAEYEQNEAMQPFKAGELLTRVRILQLAGCARVLVWTLHHAVVDHWSIQSMMSDIQTICNGDPLPSRRSFKPMIKYLQRLDRHESLGFWRNHLRDAPPMPLFQGRPNSLADLDTFTSRELFLQQNLLSRLGVMTSTLITCAWSIVLSAHSNSNDVVFGQVLAARSEHISLSP